MHPLITTGARDHRLLPWTSIERRGFEDHACPEADSCWSEN